ncbi:MAG: cation-translocating P-type ATPase [Bacteroidota bacterium]
MSEFYKLSPGEALKQLNSVSTGLETADVAAIRQQYGENLLREADKRSKLSIFLGQFADVMVIILLAAATVSFFLGEHTDGFVILAIIIANSVLGFYQEYNAEESVRMLQKMTSQGATVLRGGRPVKVEASEIVPGDVLLLEAGNIVPADARLLQADAFKTDEAALTGESNTVQKHIKPITEPDLGPADRLNMVFKGTIVSNGSAKAVVTETGMQTELGKIAGMMGDKAPRKTPLQLRLAVFSKQLAAIVVVICLLVFGLGVWRGEPAFPMFLTALSMAVAALPEALPAVITIALAQGAARMVKHKALMRNLPAVETLGSVTYICTDKTGTLTKNVMTVEKVIPSEGNEELLSRAMMLNNEVLFSENDKLIGDSTETALVEYEINKGQQKAEADEKFPHDKTIHFDSERMRMGTFHKHGSQWILFVKGAPAKICEILSNKFEAQVPALLEQNREMAGQGLRVLFFAYKIFDTKPGEITAELEKDLEYLGMAAMIDPPREEVKAAIQECKNAGIKTVMITGDQPATAQAIAQRLGLTDEGKTLAKTGVEMSRLSPEKFEEAAKSMSVYARVTPGQKLDFVKALQKNGEFVAMTGDGVNDAPSLKQADIGVAMGITGTDVSKEAADMILLDDNFATIVKAVAEGRRIYDNIKKFILYVLSSNLGEILTIFMAPFLGFDIPLLPIHILWINLVTDGLPGLALVNEEPEPDLMKRPPRPTNESIFAGGLIPKIIGTGIIITAASLLVQWYAREQGYNLLTQQTLVFTTLCFVQLGNAISARSAREIMISMRFFANPGMWGAIALTIALQTAIVFIPYLQKTFKTIHIGLYDCLCIMVVTLVSFLFIELVKYLSRPKTAS